MTITIGEKKLATRRPSDLDDQLIAATGLNAAEHAAILARGGTGVHVARAAMPFLSDKEAPDAHELASMIDAEDTADVRAQVANLLAPPSAPSKADAPNG